jgi:cytochrome P450
VQSAWWSARPADFLERCRQRYGDTFTVRLMQGGRWVFVSHPDDARAIFTSEPGALLAGTTRELLEALFGPSSVHQVDREEHLRLRRLLSPPLHGERLARYARVTEEAVLQRLDSWPLDEEGPALPHLRDITLEVIMRGLFGAAESEGGSELERRVRAVLELTMGDASVVAATLLPARLSRYASGSRVFPFRRAKEALDAALLEQIRRRRTTAEGEDMLSLLLDLRDERGEPLSDAELKDNLITLIVAGHETTATAIAWALHALARHPAALEAVYAGIESGDEASLDRVVQETLRLHPTVPLAMRRPVRPFPLRGGLLPAGTNVGVCIQLLQRFPGAWADPDEFRPDRFLAKPSPYAFAWAPFGGGTRRCLGASLATLEMKMVLRTILSQRRLTTVSRPAEKVASLALRPSRGARITLRDRQPAPRRTPPSPAQCDRHRR